MRWLADECIDAALVHALRAASHDVAYIAETAAGLTDTDVLFVANTEHRLFLTEDKDFGELVFRFRLEVPGLVLLRIASAGTNLKWRRLETVIHQIGEGLFGRYAVVTETRIRSRPLI